MLHIHTLTVGPLETNCYILYADNCRECLIIDPGYEPDRVLDAVKELGKTISAILLTHGHFDHVGGVREIFSQTDCDIYLCPADCQMPETMTAGPLCYTNSYQDGDSLNLAGLTLQVLHTPGHTPGSVCLLCENALFAGDTLFAGSCGRTDLPCGDWDTLASSLARLKALPGDYTVYPGHGEATKLSLERIYNHYMR
ncbi:MAG: MBL fold metallo-hydrolase [Oscillospiraceae bacterium]|nr:MBL fold metallo-hydrolase [Oscillospiraceae bacterium]